MGGAPAARGCLIEERKVMFLEELPLRGLLDRGEKGDVSGGGGGSRCAGLLDRAGGIGDVSWGSSRCAELLGRGEKDDVSGGAPAARAAR